jgi:ParB/RepB/Spo0J family partition protein
MNAPHPIATTQAADGILIDAQLGQLVASKTQPRVRKGFDEISLNELAASIRAVGVAQPILIRKIEGKEPRFEIVCGERRFRASKMAGIASIPAMLRTLTDWQVVQIQLIENVQREDLDELEEAEGYERLMKQKDDKGNPYTADRIAELMSVSRATIYARLKLLDLCQAAREHFYKGELDASRALLISRISPDKIQLEALKGILQQDMSYRKAHEYIQREFMLELKQAIFDIKDATLVKKSGSCADCPKRTGNQPELFGDVKSKDVCTDSVCFGIKKAAHFLIIRNKAEAEGAKVITGKEAQKILPYSYSQNHYMQENGYATPDTKIPNDPKGRTWEQALKQTKLLDAKDGKKAVQPTIIENPHNKGEIIQAINIEQATKALREQGYEVTLRSQSSRPVKTEKEKEADAKLKAQIKAENIYRARLIETIHAKAEQDLCGNPPQLRPEVFRLLAKEIFDQSKAYAAKAKMVETQLGEKVSKQGSYESNKAFKKHMDTLSPQQCMLIMIDLIMFPEEKVEDYQVKNKDIPDTLLALAAMHEINAAAIKTQAEQEIKDAADAKKKAKPATVKKPIEKAKAPANPTAKKASPAASKTVPTPTPAAPAATLGDGAKPTLKPRTEWPFPTPAAQAQGAKA